MGIEKMIRSVQTLILEIAVPKGVVSDFYLISRTCLPLQSEHSLGPRVGQVVMIP